MNTFRTNCGEGASGPAAFLAALEEAGCHPRQIGATTWVAICPVCRERGHFSLMTVRWRPDGVDVNGCGGQR